MCGRQVRWWDVALPKVCLMFHRCNLRIGFIRVAVVWHWLLIITEFLCVDDCIILESDEVLSKEMFFL